MNNINQEGPMMMNLYTLERSCEERRAAMIAAAAGDGSRFWLSRAIARMLMARLEPAPHLADPAQRTPDRPAALRQI